MGGMVAAIEKGYPQAEISRASYEYPAEGGEGGSGCGGRQPIYQSERPTSPSKR
jgi:hypothetical protein